MGKPAFQGTNLNELIEKNKIAKINFKLKKWENYSKEAKHITKRMVTSNPEMRISLAEIQCTKWLKLHETHKSLKKLSTNFESVDNKPEKKQKFKHQKNSSLVIDDINEEGKIKLATFYQIKPKLITLDNLQDAKLATNKNTAQKQNLPSYFDFSVTYSKHSHQFNFV